MSDLKELLSLCKNSVDISVNEHKNRYESIQDNLGYLFDLDDDLLDEIGKDVYAEMIKRDCIVCIIAYPNTPVGSFQVYHYDIDVAIDIVVESIKAQYKSGEAVNNAQKAYAKMINDHKKVNNIL